MSPKNRLSPSCPAMFITAVFATAEIWDQARYPAIGGQRRKVWGHMKESGSAIKNEMLPFSGKLKELLIIVVRKINSITKTKVVFSFTQDLDLKGKKKMDQRDGSVDASILTPQHLCAATPPRPSHQRAIPSSSK